MKTETLIRRAAEKMKAKLLKQGRGAAEIRKALSINFPSLYANEEK